MIYKAFRFDDMQFLMELMIYTASPWFFANGTISLKSPSRWIRTTEVKIMGRFSDLMTSDKRKKGVSPIKQDLMDLDYLWKIWQK